MARGISNTARAGPSKPTLVMPRRQLATKASLPALYTPPPTPGPSSSSSSSDVPLHGKGSDYNSTSAMYYERFLLYLYKFGQAAETGVDVEAAWAKITSMDPFQISESLRFAKAEDLAKSKTSTQTKAEATPLTPNSAAHNIPQPNNKGKQPTTDGLTGPEEIAEMEASLIRSMAALNPSDVNAVFGANLETFRDISLGPPPCGHEACAAPSLAKAGFLDPPPFTIDMTVQGSHLIPIPCDVAATASVVKSAQSCPHEACKPAKTTSCSCPRCEYISKLPAFIPLSCGKHKPTAHTQAASPQATAPLDHPVDHHSPADKPTKSSSSAATKKTKKKKQNAAKPSTPTPPLALPATELYNTDVWSVKLKRAVVLNGAETQLRGKTVTTSERLSLWDAAVQVMPRGDFTYTPSTMLNPEKALLGLDSLRSLVDGKRKEMDGILSSGLAGHLHHIVGGDDIDALMREDLAGVLSGAFDAESILVALLGRIAYLSMASHPDPEVHGHLPMFNPVPIPFSSKDLRSGQSGRGPILGALTQQFQRNQQMCRTTRMLCGLLQVDEETVMVWSAHFGTRRAVIYAPRIDLEATGKEALTALLGCLQCCKSCEKQPWEVQSGGMWVTDRAKAGALSTHIIELLLTDRSAHENGLNPAKYKIGAEPEQRLITDAQLAHLSMQQNVMRINNFFALKKLSDDLGIVIK